MPVGRGRPSTYRHSTAIALLKACGLCDRREDITMARRPVATVYRR